MHRPVPTQNLKNSMKTQLISILGAALSLLPVPLVAQTAVITWGPATPVSTAIGNSSDVSTNGTLVEAYNAVPNDDIATAANVIVNGVTFVPTTSLLNADPKNGGPSDFSADTNAGDPEYDALLSRPEFGGGSSQVTVVVGDGDGNGSVTGAGLLVPGEDYEIQVWYVDTRNTRITPVGDGNGNTVELSDEYSIGTFTANGTTQNITLASPGFGQAHITAYQIRSLAADPPPTVVLSTPTDPVSNPYTVTATFSEDVNGLTDGDFVVSNGVASGVSPASGPASVYTVTITPPSSGFVTVDLPATTVQDTGLNDNFASNTLTSLYIPAGTEQPMATLSTAAIAPVSGPYTVDVTFDEAVNGLDVSDFEVVRGTASDVLPASGPASVYTVTITPTVDGDVEVTLPFNSVLDDDDNLPNLVSNTLITEYIAPSIPTVTLLNPISGPIVSGTYTVDIEFLEDVTGLELTDFVVTNGTASNLTPASGPEFLYTVDITPTATGLVSVFLPSGSVTDDDGEGQTNPDSRYLYANNLPAGAYTSGLIDLSGRDVDGLGAGESNGFFAGSKTFDSVSDLSMNDVAWTDGINSGTFDLSFLATGSLNGIRRGGKGAFGPADDVNGSGLVDPGESIVLDTLAVSDLQGDLAGAAISNIQFVAVYLGNKHNDDGVTINGLISDGAPGGDTIEDMRNDIQLASSATIAGTGTGDGYSINGIAITFDVVIASNDYAAWIAGFGGAGNTLPEETNDNDGENVLDAYFGTDPTVDDNNALQVVAQSGSTFTFRHKLAKTAVTDVTGLYEWSTTLGSWIADGVEDNSSTVTFGAPSVVDAANPNFDIVEVDAVVTGAALDKVFARINASVAGE